MARAFRSDSQAGLHDDDDAKMAGLPEREHESCYLGPKTCYIEPMARHLHVDDGAKKKTPRLGQGVRGSCP
jgi:hypothetical protein